MCVIEFPDNTFLYIWEFERVQGGVHGAPTLWTLSHSLAITLQILTVMDAKPPIRILLVEDNPADAQLTVEILGSSPCFTVEHVTTLAAVTALASSDMFDLALVDLGLDDCQGLATAIAVMAWRPSLPIIVLTSNDDEEAAQQAIKLGAQDYLIKGTLAPDLFFRSIRYSIERKKNSQALQENEAFLRKSQEIAHIGSWRYDMATRELCWSEEIFRILGLVSTSSSVAYETFRELVHPEDQQIVDTFYFVITHGGTEYEFVHRIIRPGGQIRVVRQKCEKTQGGKGEGGRWFGIIHDITDERQQETERQLLVTAMEQAAESIVITDADGIIQYVNPFFEKTSGYPSVEVLGQKTSILKSGRQSVQFYSEMWSTLLAGRVWSGRLVNRRKDGVLYTEDCNISPVRDGGGTIVNFVAVKYDVTAALALEEKYYNAQKMEAVGTLAGGIAHDFNNILTSILGYSALVHRALEDGSPEKDDLRQVMKAAGRAKDLVRQILDFSRRSEQEAQPVQTRSIVKEALKLLRSSIPENIEIRQKVTSANTCVMCTPIRFHQVIMNLCTNAYQAMPEGGVLSVELGQIQPDHTLRYRFPELINEKYLMLKVGDTGDGVDHVSLKKIFDPYFSTKGLGKGTGLGLSVVHGIVTDLGGLVSVESKRGQGTVFTVYLPLLEEEQVPESKSVAENIGLRGRERILSVDDEESITMLIKKILEPLGYSVTCCHNGPEALARFTEAPHCYDLVISDYYMPKLLGTRLIEEVKKIRPEIPAILSSGLVDRIAPEDLNSSLVEYVLEKPIDGDELSRTVRQVLGR